MWLFPMWIFNYQCCVRSRTLCLTKMMQTPNFNCFFWSSKGTGTVHSLIYLYQIAWSFSFIPLVNMCQKIIAFFNSAWKYKPVYFSMMPVPVFTHVGDADKVTVVHSVSHTNANNLVSLYDTCNIHFILITVILMYISYIQHISKHIGTVPVP